MLSFSTFLLEVVKSNRNLVTMIAVNMLTTIPQNNTVANPLIGPVPYWYNTPAAIPVLKFASTIVVIAL